MPDAVKDYVAIIVAAGITMSIVIILLLAWGIVWQRRWMAARRRVRTLLLDGGEFQAREYQSIDDTSHVPPLWVERWVDLKKTGRDGQWARIMPLSMTVAVHSDPNDNVRKEHDKTAWTSPPVTKTIQSISPPEVYVTIVVAMPQDPGIHEAPEYEFGVAKAPVGRGFS